MSQYEPHMSATATNNLSTRMAVGRGVMTDGQGIQQYEPQRFAMLANNMITNQAGHRGMSQHELQFPNQNYSQATNPINRNLAGIGNTNNTPSTMGDYYNVGDIMRNGICLGPGTNCSCMVTMPVIKPDTLWARNACPPTTIEEEREFWARHIAAMEERYEQETEQRKRLLTSRLETIHRGIREKRELLNYLKELIGSRGL
jgi:hypothetical protein